MQAHPEESLLKDIATRRKLKDMARSQAQDIAILRQELLRLHMKTYPTLPKS
jgi:hypothetical protein